MKDNCFAIIPSELAIRNPRTHQRLIFHNMISQNVRGDPEFCPIPKHKITLIFYFVKFCVLVYYISFSILIFIS